MGLFQVSVLKKYLRAQNSKVVDEAWLRYTKHFFDPEYQNNVRAAKEEQYQAGFLRDLFVNILGYTLNPDPGFNLTTELKNIRGAKKTDGAILDKEGSAVAVIELKGTNTVSLDKIEDQAFGYKRNQSGCNYVVTSNFEKLRFYIDDSISYEDFPLFQLTKDQFELLWLCLSHDHIMSGLPKKIKEESVTEEEEVTKKLYKDYSAFRRQVFDSIANRNSEYDKLTLFKSTQKLLDRFLFVFFAEDRGLIPPNSIRKVISEWTDLRDKYDSYVPLYDRFRKYFGYLNTGHKDATHDIFAYNGGLFEPDPLLDKITIDDDILYTHTQRLSDYDFESEVSVNILGHIFEHSLNEIEEIQAEIDGQEVEKSKTKRKRDGVFYTPKYITKYIVDSTVGKLCQEKKEELKIDESEYRRSRKHRKGYKLKELQDKLENYREWLMGLTICDPACGSGAFLTETLEFLIAEHSYIDDLQEKLLGGGFIFPNIENSILERNLYGVDINQESVEIAKLSLWIRTAQRGRKLTTLNDNIKCGNSLIDDAQVAGDKAFKWKEEFPDVFANGGFDVVVGNPPYVFARGNFNETEKEYYKEKYESAQYQINTYPLFIEQSVGIIRDDGALGLIVPNAWLMVYSARDLRKYLLINTSITEVVNLSGYSFEGVNVETIILNARKKKNKENVISILLSDKKEFYRSHTRVQDDFAQNELFELRVFSDSESIALLDKVAENTQILDSLVNIKAGLKAYQSGKGKPKQSKETVKERPFDYSYKYDENTHPYLEGKMVNRYSINWTHGYLRFGSHLAEPRMFEGEKIIIREITGKYPRCIIGSYTNELYLFNLSNIAVVPKSESLINMKYVLSILNSRLMSYYFLKKTAKSVRKMFPKIILGDLRKFPIKICDSEKQTALAVLVNKTIEANHKVNGMSNSFTKLCLSKLEFDKLSRNLQSWYNLSFIEFVKELKKKKVKLSLPDQAEWMSYFEEEKTKVVALQSEIDRVEAEIDKLVYELYGLTEEEIRIVDEAVG